MSLIKKAARSNAALKIGLSGPSGSGKSYTALLLAKGMLGSLDNVVVLDTENGSANLYSDLGDYSVLPFDPPYSPVRYVSAIDLILKELPDTKLIIMDSASHEWEGTGGCLDMHSKMEGNSYTNWNKITPLHNAFKDKILQTPLHFIVTMRTKQDYVMEQNSKGKMAPRKVGLKENQREGFEFELTLNFRMDMNHNATASKDRTGMFSTDIPFEIGEATGRKIAMWNNGEKSDEFFKAATNIDNQEKHKEITQ